jgi:hypothetical protein
MLALGLLTGGRRGGRRRPRRMSLAETLITQYGNDDTPNDNQPPEQDNEPKVNDDSEFTDKEAQQLEKLAQLKDKGVITEEDFNKKKKLILGI